jgi:hypothetical protein
MFQKKRGLSRTLAKGIAAGLAAGAAAALADRFMERLVSEEQKGREKQVREDAAHKLAGPYFARKLLGHELSESGRRRARAIFGVTYGVMWGLIYGGLRKKIPAAAKFLGLPFAVPFFFGCDGAMAPLLGVSPGIQKIPWQINAKELGNHIVWTATAEAVHRLADGFSENERSGE